MSLLWLKHIYLCVTIIYINVCTCVCVYAVRLCMPPISGCVCLQCCPISQQSSAVNDHTLSSFWAHMYAMRSLCEANLSVYACSPAPSGNDLQQAMATGVQAPAKGKSNPSESGRANSVSPSRGGHAIKVPFNRLRSVRVNEPIMTF